MKEIIENDASVAQTDDQDSNSQEQNGASNDGGPDVVMVGLKEVGDKPTLGKLKFGSSDDLMALAAQSFAGTRTAKIITQFKEWDSTHSVEKVMSKNNSSDNLLEKPSNSLSKYYENYNADKAKASSRRTVIEPPTDELQPPSKEDIERQMSYEDEIQIEKKLHGVALVLENIFHIEERGTLII